MVRLLLTRPAAAAQRFVESLSVPDAEVVISPVLEIRPTGAPAPDMPWSSLIITSRNALAFYQGPVDLATFVVGEETARVARARGLNVQSVAPDARTLLDAIPPDGPHPILHLRGRHVAVPIAQTLRARGQAVLEWCLYDQVACPLTEDARAVLRDPRPVILPLFSPRSARLLADELTELAPQAPLFAVALSAAVAAQFGSLCTTKMTVCDTPTASEMAKTVQVVAKEVALLEGKASLS